MNTKSIADYAGGGTPRYEQRKKSRNLAITDIAWQGLKDLATVKGLSLAEFLEQIGRGKFDVQVIDSEIDHKDAA